MATLEMEFRKMTKTPAHAFQTKSKPTGAWTQTEEVRAGKMQRNNGSTKDQAVKKRDTDTNIETHNYVQHTRTYRNATKKVHNCQNPCPNQRQGGRAAHDKTPLADCLLLSPPSSRGTHD